LETTGDDAKGNADNACGARGRRFAACLVTADGLDGVPNQIDRDAFEGLDGQVDHW
jgi:hypothetical protein